MGNHIGLELQPAVFKQVKSIAPDLYMHLTVLNEQNVRRVWELRKSIEKSPVGEDRGKHEAMLNRALAVTASMLDVMRDNMGGKIPNSVGLLKKEVLRTGIALDPDVFKDHDCSKVFQILRALPIKGEEMAIAPFVETTGDRGEAFYVFTGYCQTDSIPVTEMSSAMFYRGEKGRPWHWAIGPSAQDPNRLVYLAEPRKGRPSVLFEKGEAPTPGEQSSGMIKGMIPVSKLKKEVCSAYSSSNSPVVQALVDELIPVLVPKVLELVRDGVLKAVAEALLNASTLGNNNNNNKSE